MTSLAPLTGNDYRKRVLAPIEARGGMDETDPFEVYDIPLDSVPGLTDAQVEAQMGQVWALWQKQRDHPKFRGLVTALLEAHEHSRGELTTEHGRLAMAKRATAFREKRDAGRFAQIDTAVRRLVDRFGGLPRGKVEGLRTLAVHSGIGAEDFEARIRRYRLIDDAPAAPIAPAAADLSGVYRQVRADLDELGQLDSEPPLPSLYALIGLPPGAAPQHVRAQRDALAARNRARRPDRRRALVDDLLAAVTSLLVDGDPAAYLETLAADVAATLRPRVAAAILVEDTLTIADHEVLLAAAEEAGLDRPRAIRLLSELAREHGTTAPAAMAQAGGAAPPPALAAPVPLTRPPVGAQPPSPPVSTAAWQEELTRARAALRGGLLLTAQRHVHAARSHAGQTLPPIRAVDDEVARRIAEATDSWRAIDSLLSAGQAAAALPQLEALAAGAAEILSARGETAAAVLARVRTQLVEVDSELSAALALAGPARELAVLALAVRAPGSPAVLAALASLPPAAPTGVTARRVPGGVVVSWRASPSVGEVAYRVLRREADGTTRALGSTAGLAFETSAAEGPLPQFVVIARRAGIESAPGASSDLSSPLSQPPVPAPVAAGAVVLADPVPTLEIAPYRGRLRVMYPVPAAGRVEVVRLPPGVAAPAAGSAVPDPSALGAVLSSMTPGLALDSAPAQPVTTYIAVSIEDGKGSVAGASAVHVSLPAATGLVVAAGRLTWVWPAGCTEAVVAWRGDAPPTGPADPDAQRRKVTITRYEIDGGLLLPADRPMHVAVFGCARVDGRLVTALAAEPSARIALS